MGYSKVSQKSGKTYWLHKKEGKSLFFFSSLEEGSIELPEGYETTENPKTGLPLLKKKQ